MAFARVHHEYGNLIQQRGIYRGFKKEVFCTYGYHDIIWVQIVFTSHTLVILHPTLLGVGLSNWVEESSTASHTHCVSETCNKIFSGGKKTDWCAGIPSA